MTRIALISDIHGNLPALEDVATDMKQFAPDHVVVAGDMVNWGPFSDEVLQFVFDRKWTAIRGNNEYYFINAKPPRRPKEWADYNLIPWLFAQISDWRYVIAGLADDLLLLYPDAPDAHLCHGIPEDCWTGVYDARFTSNEVASKWMSKARAKTIFCGHTHIPLDRHVNGYHIINPGSVGVPLMGEAVSSYMILDGDEDGWHVTEHRMLPLDMSSLESAWKTQSFLEQGGVTALMVMEEFRQSRIMVHAFMWWMKEVHPGEEPTLALGEEFLQTDPTPYTLPQYQVVDLRRSSG